MWEVGEGNVLNQFLELYLKNIHFCDKIAWCAWDIRYMRVCAKIVSTQSVSWTYPDKTLILWQNCLVCMSCVRYRVYVSIHYLIRFSSLNFQICKFRELQENWKFIFEVAKLISERHKFYKCLELSQSRWPQWWLPFSRAWRSAARRDPSSTAARSRRQKSPRRTPAIFAAADYNDCHEDDKDDYQQHFHQHHHWHCHLVDHEHSVPHNVPSPSVIGQVLTGKKFATKS